MMEGTKIEMYKCNICNKEYKTKKYLKNHEKTHNLEEKKCKICGLTFKYKTILQRHELTHSGTIKFWCKICFKSFKSNEETETHEIQHITKKFKCKICPDQTFLTEENYLLHIKLVHQGKFVDYFMCSDCGKQYKTKSELMTHINSKCGTIKIYKCQVCSQELMTAGSLYNHMLRHKGERTFMCRFCAKLFLTAGQLKVHERSHTQDKAFICNVCGKGFCHRQSLITHSTLHTGVKPFLCENCGDSFSCIGNLLKHRTTHSNTCGLIPLTTHSVKHPSTKIKVKVNTPKNSRLKAYEKEKEVMKKLQKIEVALTEDSSPVVKEDLPIVNFEDEIFQKDETSNSVIQKIVVEEKINDKWEVKGVCLNNKDFINVESEQKEIKLEEKKVVEEHEEEKPKKKKCKVGKSNMKRFSKFEIEEYMKDRGIVEVKESIACKFCARKYNDVRWLMRHEFNHEKKKEPEILVKCSCCKEKFSNKEDCKKHQESNHADILSCQICDKIFANPDSLRCHKDIFHGGISRKIYLYICEKCGQQFKLKATLKLHNASNCGTGPFFECEICKKKFSSNAVRKTHMKVHDPEKKILCKFCGKSFRWKGQLIIHERSHTGEKPFTCLYCPKAFAYRESLITHSSLHTGIKPHLCEACGSRFSCIGNLIKHRVTHASTCGAWYNRKESSNLEETA